MDIPLQFKYPERAIELSGETGTELKTHILSLYYKFWTKNALGSSKKRQATIVDMDSATGRIYISEKEVVQDGSAFHALRLKFSNSGKYQKSPNVMLIESDCKCHEYLLLNIEEKFPELKLEPSKNEYFVNGDKTVHVFSSPDQFLSHTDQGRTPGITLYYFDPLLAPDWCKISRIADARIDEPYLKGTEFLIFFFSSDWVRGRKGFAALPRNSSTSDWTKNQTESARKADLVFGSRIWLNVMEQSGSDGFLMDGLVALYKKQLRKWFRFVQALPFVPKDKQRYDLICCSNSAYNILPMNEFYEKKTYSFLNDLNQDDAFRYFKQDQPKLTKLDARPKEWQVLWRIIEDNVPDGVCDEESRNLLKIVEHNPNKLGEILKWLREEHYLNEVDNTDWGWPQFHKFPQYEISWDNVVGCLRIPYPKPPKPLLPEDVEKIQKMHDK